MRELSDYSCRHQAQQFIAHAGRGGGDFERWADSKDLAPEDREEIRRQVTYLLMAGER